MNPVTIHPDGTVAFPLDDLPTIRQALQWARAAAESMAAECNAVAGNYPEHPGIAERHRTNAAYQTHLAQRIAHLETRIGDAEQRAGATTRQR